jgi:hypothetical protein
VFAPAAQTTNAQSVTFGSIVTSFAFVFAPAAQTANAQSVTFGSIVQLFNFSIF